MTARVILLGLIAPSLFASLGCNSGTETGNPRSEPAVLGFGLHSSSPDVGVGGSASGVRVESAWLSFESIGRSACTSVGPLPQPVVTELVVNLLDPGAALPDLIDIDPLCGLNITLASGALPNDTNSTGALGGASILVTGTRLDGAPFAISTSATIPFSLLATPPIDPEAYESLLLGFDVAVWLTGTDLEAIPLDGGGVARLDGALQPGSTATFESQIPAGTKLYPDLDGDGALSADELAQPVAE